MMATHSAEMDQLTTEYNAKENGHLAEIENLQDAVEKKDEDNNILRQQVIDAQVEIESSKESAKQTQEDLSQKHLEQLENVKVAIKEELLTDHMKQFEKMNKDLEEAHTSEMEELRLSLSQEYQGRISELEDSLRSKDEEMNRSITELRTTHERELDNLQADYETKLQEELDRTKSEISFQEDPFVTEDLEQKHRQEIEEMQQKFKEDTEKIEKQYQDKIKMLEEKHMDDTQETKDSLEKELQHVKGLLEKAQEENAKLKTQDETDNTQENYQKEIFRLEEELNSEREKLDKFVVNHQEEIDKLKEQYQENYLTQCDIIKIEIEKELRTKLREEIEVEIRTNIYEEVRKELEEKQHSETLSSEDRDKEIKAQMEEEFRLRIQTLRVELEEQIWKEFEEKHLHENQSPVKSEEVQMELMQLQEELDVLMQEKETKEQQMSDRTEQINALSNEIEANNQETKKYKEEIERQQERIAELEIQLSDQDTSQTAKIKELENKLETQKEEFDLIIGRRSREHEEGDNLLSMLKSDLERISQERDTIQSTNDRLLQILSDTVKSNIAVEDKINKRLTNLIAEGQSRSSSPPLSGSGGRTTPLAQADMPPSATDSGASLHGATAGQDASSSQDDGTTIHDTSVVSMFSDEGCDLSQRINESLFVGPDLEPDSEEVIVDSGNRLQSSVEKLLDMIEESTRQLHEAQNTQRELLNTVGIHSAEVKHLTQKCEDLEQRLKEEGEAKEFLVLELNKAEGLVEGYEAEKAETDSTIRTLEDKKEVLVTELERVKSKLQELEEEKADVVARAQEIQHVKDTLESSVSSENQGLLVENSKLNEERRELQKQHEREREEMVKKIQEIEFKLDDTLHKNDISMEHKNQEIEDLQQQLDAMDKQHKSLKQFVEEQTQEREQERDDYQQEIEKLKQKIKEKERQGSTESRLQREVQELEEQLKEKTENYSVLSLLKDQLEHDVQQGKNVENELRGVIRQLEDDLESKTKMEQETRQKLESLESQLNKQQEVNEELTEELKVVGNMDDLQSTVNDLESQLDTARRAEAVANQKQKELEEELKNLKTLEEELTHDKETLQQQVYDQMTQLSGLKAQVDMLKMGNKSTDEKEHIQELKELLEQEREALENRNREIHDLEDQLDQIREESRDREEDLQQMAAQIEVAEKEKNHIVDQLREENKELELQKEELEAQIRVLRDQVDSTPMSELAQKIIDDKNEEIDHLNSQIHAFEGQLAWQNDTPSPEEVERLNNEIMKQNEEIATKSKELEELKQMIEDMQESQQMLDQVRNMLAAKETEIEELKQQLEENKKALLNAKNELQKKDFVLEQTKIEMNRKKEEVVTALTEVVREKEHLIDELQQEKATLEENASDVNELQTKMKKDNAQIQGTLQRKQQEIEELKNQLSNIRPQAEGMNAEVQKYEKQIYQLQKNIADCKAEIEEKNELLEIKEREVTQLKLHFENIRREKGGPGGDVDAENLHKQIKAKEALIDQLQDKLSQSESDLRSRQDEFSRAIQELESQRKNLEDTHQRKTEEIVLMRNDSNDRYLTSDTSQGERQQQLKEEVEQLRKELTETKKLLGTAQRSELDGLRKELTNEHQRSITELRSRHIEEIENLRMFHEQEVQRISQISIDFSDEETDFGQKLHREIEAHARVDASVLGRISSIGTDTEHTDFMNESSSEAISHRIQALLEKVHNEGVKVLSLSELKFLRRHSTGSHAGVGTHLLCNAWEDEKESLLAAIQSLKDLLAETQRTRDISRDGDGNGADWRTDLLKAVNNVFSKEREGLLARLRTYTLTHGDGDGATIQQLQQQIQTQEEHQRTSFDQLFSSDRQTMLAEISDLRSHLSAIKLERQEDSNRFTEQMDLLEEQFTKKERHLKRQMELLEYKIQQEKVVSEDLRSSLQIEKSRTVELSSQLSREKNSSTDLETELSDTQTQLSKLKDALEREQNRLMSASTALQEEKKQGADLKEALVLEHTENEHFREELEDERYKSQQTNQRHNHEIQKLKREVDSEKDKRIQALNHLEKERMTASNLRHELDMEKEHSKSVDNQHRGTISELQSALELQKSKCSELNVALQRERNLASQLRETLDIERGSQSSLVEREKAAIGELKAMLDLEKDRLKNLQNELMRERSKVTSLNGALNSIKTKSKEEMDKEKLSLRELKTENESIKVRNQELEKQVRFEQEKMSTLQADRDRIQASLLSTRERLHSMEDEVNSRKADDREKQQERAREREQEWHKELDRDAEMQQLRQINTELEMKLAETKRLEIQAKEERDIERLKNAISPRSMTSSPRSTPRNFADGDHGQVQIHAFTKKQLESLRQRQQLLVIRHQEELARTPTRTSKDRGSSVELDSISRSLKEILGELKQIQVNIKEPSGDVQVQGWSVPALNEKILHHNNDLTTFITRVTEEKTELRRALGRLEEQVWIFRQKEEQLSQAELADDKLACERSSWARERASMSLKINDAEKEINKLKDDLRRSEIKLQNEREKYSTPHKTPSALDNEKMQRLYGRYIRAESFRKALIYQKKYLLLLLGGFQDCEEQTLSTIAKMGVYPSVRDLQTRTRHSRPYSRFRSAVRVVIAVSRLKFLVTKWKRAARVGSPAIGGTIISQNNGATYIPSSSHYAPPRKVSSSPLTSCVPTPSARAVQSDYQVDRQFHGNGYAKYNQYTSPPTKDVTHRNATRSRYSTIHGDSRRAILSALDPPHEPAPTPPPSVKEEASPPNDDEDDSLNEYIHRLESLQARLGSVSNHHHGNTGRSYATTSVLR